MGVGGKGGMGVRMTHCWRQYITGIPFHSIPLHYTELHHTTHITLHYMTSSLKQLLLTDGVPHALDGCVAASMALEPVLKADVVQVADVLQGKATSSAATF
jgi:hypothetical protein